MVEFFTSKDEDNITTDAEDVSTDDSESSQNSEPVQQNVEDPVVDAEQTSVQEEEFIEDTALHRRAKSDDVDIMKDVSVKVDVVLGKAEMKVGELRKIGKGAIIKLNRSAGDLLDLVVNNKVIARGALSKDENGRLSLIVEELG